MGLSNLRILTLKDKPARQSGSRRFLSSEAPATAEQPGLLVEELFRSMLALERLRAERSRKPFLLMLVEMRDALQNGSSADVVEKVYSALTASTRETDLIGWYYSGSVLGVIFTEIGAGDRNSVPSTLQTKVKAALLERLKPEQAKKIHLSFHLFPQRWDKESRGRLADVKLYPDLTRQISRKRFELGIKRVMDVVGSIALLLFFAPVLAAIAIAIKLTSKGPVLFEQERLGQFGKRFKCLKFRTMYVNSDAKIHQDFVKQFIKGQNNCAQAITNGAVYKITDDPRVTPVGQFLRKTSLDEFPQFWNVLRGEMSLVGPRPPVPYECEMYDIWHRRRVLEVKPGVTGLWQVSGRSRTRFDEMVRLDLQYSRAWSLWLDLKILFLTPKAVLLGEGAY